MINDIATTKKIAAPAHRSTFSTPTLGGVVKFNCCARVERDRKSTCLNSSHDQISYAVFCLKKKIRRVLFRSDRKSTRLNSSHDQISYAVFCLKKKKKNSPASDDLLKTHDCCMIAQVIRTK